MWVFSTGGFTSAVEYSPPRTAVVTPAKYETVTPAVTEKDPVTGVVKTITPAETKKVADEVREPFSDPYEKDLKDYSPATYDSVDPDTGEKIPGQLSSHLLIRARVEADLEPLKKYDPDAVTFEDKSADYQFRIIIKRTAMAQYNYDLTMGIDYNSHVKETIEKRAPKVEGGRYSALMTIWTACNKWQPVRPYSGKYNWEGSSSYTKYPKNNGGYVSSFGAVEPYVPKAASGNNVLAGVTGKGSVDKDDSFLDTVLDALPDLDDPSEQMEWWELKIAEGEPTRKTMEAQIADLLRAVGEDGNYDLYDVVDKLEELYGTCDIDTIPTGDLWDAVDTRRKAGAEDSPLVKVL